MYNSYLCNKRGLMKLLGIALLSCMLIPLFSLDIAEARDTSMDRGGRSVRIDGPHDMHGGPLAYAGISTTEAANLARAQNMVGLPDATTRNGLKRGDRAPSGAMRLQNSAMLGGLAQHTGYTWRVSGNDLILVYGPTSTVADVLPAVFK